MLCIDRCLSLIFPVNYDFNKKKIFLVFTLAYIFIGTGILIRVCSMIEVFPKSSKTSCRFFGCLMTLATPQFISLTKALFSLPNVILGIVLSVLIHKTFRNKRDKKSDKINKTVYLIIGITTLSVMLPSLLDEFAKMIFGKPLNTFLGPYGNTLCACGSTVCIQVYSKAFKRLESKFHATSKQVTTF
uniref:G-protein coupled receptors family 1 profile domain-containing protein n=1 Tax=Panagrolaimus sp. PS1159 TaxID=55785 RepID=A0AC35FGM5_9BILA